MEDYPRDMMEFRDRFSTEDACAAYLAELRWPDGFVCPDCGAPSVQQAVSVGPIPERAIVGG